MRDMKPLALHPISALPPGRLVLDCSGPIHRDWLREALFVRGLKVLVYRRSFACDQMESLPIHDGLQMASGDLGIVLKRMKESVTLIVDDVGLLHFHEHPLELLKSYYETLSLDGEAWIRFPKTFFVFLEGGRRILLQDYIAAKFPMIAKRLRHVELDPQFVRGISSPEDWVLLRKDRRVPHLNFQIQRRTDGGTSHPEGYPHAAFLEFVEVAQPPSRENGLFRRSA